MRLLYITTRISGAGGLQRVLSVKTDYLIKKGYEVTLLATNTDNDEIVYSFNPDISYHTITPDKSFPGYFISYKKLIKKKVAEINPDIVIVCDNGLKGFLLPFVLHKKHPLIYERHGSKYIEEKAESLFSYLTRGLRYKFMDYGASGFDKFIVLTDKASSEWPLKNIEVIPNPLWFNTPLSSNLENNSAVAVGRHTYEKGYDRLFKIWANIVNDHPSWILKVYGDQNPDYDLVQMAKDFGITENIEFIAAQKNILPAYLESSVFLMGSRSEGFGMVLVEAMACGVPCIAFNCPVGPSEIIQDGYNGFLITDGDIEGYTAKVNMLITDVTLRKKTGKQAKQSVSKFEIEPIMNKWIALFTSLK